MTLDSTWLGLFDEAFYLARNPDARDASGDAAAHFREHGWDRSLDPHPLFSTSWYARQLRGRSLGGRDPLAHYIGIGAHEGLSPHPLFRPMDYAERAGRDTRAATPLHAFLTADPASSASPHWLFDIDLYRALYADVVTHGLNPLLHYIAHGEAEGRFPNPFFDEGQYRAALPEGVVPPPGGALAHLAAQPVEDRVAPCLLFDPAWYARSLARAGLTPHDPLRHFIEEGDRAALSSHPLFDPGFYLRRHPDVSASDMGPLQHFMLYGRAERRMPHPLFSPSFYLNSNPDIAALGIDPHSHYIRSGGVELRRPHPMFDPEHYVRLHPEVREAGVNPLIDYLSHDAATRRHPHPLFDRLHQATATERTASPLDDPLSAYVEFRADLDQALIARAATSIPRRPLRARLPSRAALGATAPASSPLVSVLIPTYESDERLLRACFDSLRAQNYTNWEAVVVDDGSVSAVPFAVAAEYAERDPRFTAHRLETNAGISAATNAALAQARGEFVAMLDHDDRLTADALAACVAEIAACKADAVYSDQSFIDVGGAFDGAFHKPAWSPALLTGVMYVGHLLVVRRTLAVEVGGFDPTFDRLQDFEFMLRVGERTDRIAHVPDILYGWRRTPGSIASDSAAKGRIEPIQAAAVQAHLDRRGVAAEVAPIELLHHRVRVTPRARTATPPVDLIRLAPPSGAEARPQAETPGLDLFQSAMRVDRRDLQALRAAITAGSSPFVVCWDERVRPTGRWLDHMLTYLEQADVAFCAPHLFTLDGAVVAAGLEADAERGLVPALTGFRFGDDGHAGSLACDREVSALPPGLLGFRRDALEALGGLSMDYGGLYYALADASYRAAAAGRRNVAVAERLTEVDPGFDLGQEVWLSDRLIFIDRHAARLRAGDPFYNRNIAEAAAHDA